MTQFTSEQVDDYSYAHRPGKGVAGGTDLQKYLRLRDVPCPGCGYNLRDLIIDHCPRCEETLTVEIIKASERQGLPLIPLVVLRITALITVAIMAYTLFSPGGEGFFSDGCERVLTSMWSTVFGIPLSLLGIVFFALLFAATFAVTNYRGSVQRRRATWLGLTAMGLAGVGTIIWLNVVTAFSIGAFCDQCFWAHIFGAIACITVLIAGPVGIALRTGVSPEGPLGASRAQMDGCVLVAVVLLLLLAVGQLIG